MRIHDVVYLAAACLAAFTLACADDDVTPPGSDGRVIDLAVGVDRGATPDSAPAGDTAPTADRGATADKGPSADGGATAVPAEKNALFTWLKAGSYKTWDKETKIHTSTGPHSSVLTFVNAALVASLKAGSKTHPKGSAAVKEIYTDTTGATQRGWAVSIKTDADSKGGDNWYWYENFSTTSGASPVAASKGATGCKGCHSGGKDFVQTPYPLK